MDELKKKHNNKACMALWHSLVLRSRVRFTFDGISQLIKKGHTLYTISTLSNFFQHSSAATPKVKSIPLFIKFAILKDRNCPVTDLLGEGEACFQNGKNVQKKELHPTAARIKNYYFSKMVIPPI